MRASDRTRLARFVGGVPVLRLRLCWHFEGAEVVNIGCRLIPYEIIFRGGLPDIFKKKLNLAAIVGEVSQAADMVEQRQFFQLAG